jgi:hypothetical protein
MIHHTRKGDLVGPNEDGLWSIYNKETETLHLLNDSARAIWELCDGNTSAKEMARAVTQLTGVDYEDAKKDIETTLAELFSLGLVV